MIMSTATAMSYITQIGETAGSVWSLLASDGPMPISKVIKQVDAPRDLVLQAVGWLAREDKISIDEGSRSRVISLRE